MIKIGVSACFLYPDPNRAVFSPKTLAYFENEMAQYLTRTGVLPVLIPDLPEKLLAPFLEQLDGFVFPGGSDLAPQTYREKPIDADRWPGDPQRDAYELRIFSYADQHKKPVLGICRGFQLMNVYFGGSLYQDIALQKPGALVHRKAEEYDRIHHPLEIKTGGVLKEIYPQESAAEVNSVHHQAIKTLGKGLFVEAVCPQDGVIEAISCQEKDRFFLGVQWHPEFSATLKEKVIRPEPLYDYFLKKIQKS